MIDFSKISGFDWNDGNILKNELKHDVNCKECEEIFFNEPLIIAEDAKHSEQEKRFSALGISNEMRLLAVVFTIRADKIRIISARSQSKKERALYEKG